MNVKGEINKYANSEDKDALLWLFSKYHWTISWLFVADFTWISQGKRKWWPSKAGAVLYKHRKELE